MKRPGRSAYQRYCGAKFWIDCTRDPPLANRLFEYCGSVVLATGKTFHKFSPYKRNGLGMLLTDDHIQINLEAFKPFLMDMEELGFHGGNEDAPKRF